MSDVTEDENPPCSLCNGRGLVEAQFSNGRCDVLCECKREPELIPSDFSKELAEVKEAFGIPQDARTFRVTWRLSGKLKVKWTL